MNYNIVTGLGDEKDTITPPEINHLQGPDQNSPGRGGGRRSAWLTTGAGKPNVTAS